MLHRGLVGASSEQNKRNLTLTLTPTLNALLLFIVFRNKICVFVMILRLYHFYGLFLSYILYEEVMSVRIYVW